MSHDAMQRCTSFMLTVAIDSTIPYRAGSVLETLHQRLPKDMLDGATVTINLHDDTEFTVVHRNGYWREA